MNPTPKEAQPPSNIGFGTTRRTAHVVVDGDNHFIQLSTDLRDEKQLNLFMCKLLSSTGRLECEIEWMDEKEVAKQLDEINSRTFDKITIKP